MVWYELLTRGGMDHHAVLVRIPIPQCIPKKKGHPRNPVVEKKTSPQPSLRTNPPLFMGYIQVTSKFCIVSSCSNPHISWLNPHGLPFPFLIIKRWVKFSVFGRWNPSFSGLSGPSPPCSNTWRSAPWQRSGLPGREWWCQDDSWEMTAVYPLPINM